MTHSPRWLTTLIGLRRQDRSERRRLLDEAQRAAEILVERERTLERESASVLELRRAASGMQTFDINRLLAAQRHQTSVLAAQQALREQLKLLQEEVERRRAAVVEAEKQVRTLEKLADRKDQEARQVNDQREAKRLDELASLMRKVGYRE